VAVKAGECGPAGMKADNPGEWSTGRILEEREAPDFILEVDGRSIGLEMTEVFIESDGGPVKPGEDTRSKAGSPSSSPSNFIQRLVPAFRECRPRIRGHKKNYACGNACSRN